MAEVQRGDANAYGELLDEMGPIVMRFVRRHVRPSEDAQDVYQEIFMALHRARHTYEASRPLEPWLFAIARRVAADHRRRGLARQAHEVLVDVIPEAATEADGHLKTRLEQAVGALSASQREAVRLLRLEGLPADEAAEAAGTTPGALKVRAHRAYKMLRELL
jgi:RNA polymerase sigma-70 factor (ECF subfamily)